MSWTVFSCELGFSAIGWQHERLEYLTLGHRTMQDAVGRGRGASEPTDAGGFIAEVIDRVQRFAAGDFSVDFSDLPLDLDWTTAFQQRIYYHCRQIPVGATLSYGQLAERAGSPLAARAAGQAMARNRFPLIIPCHRVVGANRQLGGFSAPNGVETKRQLLDDEARFCAMVAGCTTVSAAER